MKLKEIVLMAALGASALVGCKQKDYAILEPIAIAWSTGTNANYNNFVDARKAVYFQADTNKDGKVSYTEARAMAARYPASNGYKWNGK